MSIWDILQTALLAIPLLFVIFIIGGAMKNVGRGHKGKYRESYAEDKGKD